MPAIRLDRLRRDVDLDRRALFRLEKLYPNDPDPHLAKEKARLRARIDHIEAVIADRSRR